MWVNASVRADTTRFVLARSLMIEAIDGVIMLLPATLAGGQHVLCAPAPSLGIKTAIVQSNVALFGGKKGRFCPQYKLACRSPAPQLHYTMSSSEESATATSGSEFLSESEHSSDVESSDSDANGQPP